MKTACTILILVMLANLALLHSALNKMSGNASFGEVTLPYFPILG